MEGSPIPESRSPVFTTAMRDLVVTTTNFSGQEKVCILIVLSSLLMMADTRKMTKNILLNVLDVNIHEDICLFKSSKNLTFASIFVS
jgi:hypothetical protein